VFVAAMGDDAFHRLAHGVGDESREERRRQIEESLERARLGEQAPHCGLIGDAHDGHVAGAQRGRQTTSHAPPPREAARPGPPSGSTPSSCSHRRAASG